MKEAKRENITFTSLWYRFHTFSIVSISASGGGHLEPGQLVLPVPGQAGKGRVYSGKIAVLVPDAAALLQAALSQHPHQPGRFPWGKGDLFCSTAQWLFLFSKEPKHAPCSTAGGWPRCGRAR